ncbi:LysR family transcriptional regulator [Mesorhizobium atlanticum]|uniref:LysR family transcriptional regulator n=1 Tax=Mesorhizobium atlanticum TaxID=2233532 RepID=A0A330GGP7_9HYPH|nr:LysR family transcriptional regulator [Mesorhizobium atlanticum]RAZ71799.1 LysR family transcriptional regulator [Mesorhizobium atlanticum]
MRFKGLDLNLLVALDALMTERNLTAAARSINLSQPAMSAAVARLRGYFGDELFTMRGRELVPTPRAEALASPVRDALLHIQVSVISWDEFDPRKSERCFRVMLSDYMTIIFFQKIIDRVAREAPFVSFELLPLSDDVQELFRRDGADFLILPELFLSNDHPKAKLFEDTLACAGCRTNKELSRKLSFEKYMSMGHVMARFGRSLRPSIDEWFLLEHGLKRRAEVVVQGFSLIPPMLPGTSRIGTMPFRLVEHFAKTLPLRVVELPLSLPAFTLAMQWPALHNGDPASIWMRKILLEEASRLAPSTKATA